MTGCDSDTKYSPVKPSVCLSRDRTNYSRTTVRNMCCLGGLVPMTSRVWLFTNGFIGSLCQGIRTNCRLHEYRATSVATTRTIARSVDGGCKKNTRAFPRISGGGDCARHVHRRRSTTPPGLFVEYNIFCCFHMIYYMQISVGPPNPAMAASTRPSSLHSSQTV